MSLLRDRMANAAASVGILAFACSVYALAPYNAVGLARYYGPEGFALKGMDYLWAACGIYGIGLLAFFLWEENPGESKSLRVIRFLTGRLRAGPSGQRWRWDEPTKLALRITALKCFFGPLMAVALMHFCMNAWSNANSILQESEQGFWYLFNRYGFWFGIQLILFVDVLMFTLGYMIESRRLGNEIRSVDPTWVGCLAALICYPPFNSVSSVVLGSVRSDFPQFDDPTLHVVLNLAILVLMAIYASASVALGLKASNLTHRGIVSKGPYAMVRHPAYVTKNLAWWIGSIPMLMIGFNQSLMLGLQTLGSVLGWSLLYVLRAVTEEDHLRRVDSEYARYAERVRYRFIPGLI